MSSLKGESQMALARKWKRRVAIAAGVVTLVVVALAGHWLFVSARRPPPPEVGEPFPDVRLLSPDSQVVTLEQFAGQGPVLVVFMRGFYGYICPYCTAQTAELVDRHDDIRDLGAQVLIVYPGDEASAPKFLAAAREAMSVEDREQAKIPLFLDVGKRMVERLGLPGVWVNRPATFIVDRDGVLRYRYIGRDMTDRPELAELLTVLEELQQEPPPREPTVATP